MNYTYPHRKTLYVNVENEKHFSSRIQKFFRRYQISSILKKCNAYKEQEFSVVTPDSVPVLPGLLNRSMFLDMQSEKASPHKYPLHVPVFLILVFSTGINGRMILILIIT